MELNQEGRACKPAKMQELLSHIKGPVIEGKPVYDLRVCLELLEDETLARMVKDHLSDIELDTLGPHEMLDVVAELKDERLADYCMDSKAGISLAVSDDAPEKLSMAFETRQQMIALLIPHILNRELARVMVNLEAQPGNFSFLSNTVSEIISAADLYAVDAAETCKVGNTAKSGMATTALEAADLMVAEDPSPSAKINTSIKSLFNKMAGHPGRVSLVFNSKADLHLKTLQEIGYVFLFTDWDGRGRESGYKFGMDVDWSQQPKRERDDPWSGVYRKGRAYYPQYFFGETIIGMEPPKPRRSTRLGKTTWMVNAAKPGAEPSSTDDPCLRLVIPVEVQKLILLATGEAWVKHSVPDALVRERMKDGK